MAWSSLDLQRLAPSRACTITGRPVTPPPPAGHHAATVLQAGRAALRRRGRLDEFARAGRWAVAAAPTKQHKPAHDAQFNTSRPDHRHCHPGCSYAPPSGTGSQVGPGPAGAQVWRKCAKGCPIRCCVSYFKAFRMQKLACGGGLGAPTERISGIAAQLQRTQFLAIHNPVSPRQRAAAPPTRICSLRQLPPAMPPPPPSNAAAAAAAQRSLDSHSSQGRRLVAAACER